MSDLRPVPFAAFDLADVPLRHRGVARLLGVLACVSMVAVSCSSSADTTTETSSVVTDDAAALVVDPAPSDSPGSAISTTGDADSTDPNTTDANSSEPTAGAAAVSPTDAADPTLDVVEAAETLDPMAHPFYQGESAIGKYPERVYVPNTLSNTVHVIDPKKYEIIATYPTDAIPHHVTPSWDLTELYVLNTGGNSLLVMDPATGEPKGEPIPVVDPYNLYFTPDGKNAIVVAERLRRLDIVDPKTWELKTQVSIPWPGVDHMAFSRDGTYLVASTEFSGRIVKVSTVDWVVMGEPLALGGEPIDVLRLPGGNTLLIANQGIGFGGVHVVDGDTMEELDWIETGVGTHGLMMTHDRERIFVSNRGRQTGEGSITVLDAQTLEILDTWILPGGASPDMGQLNVEGDEFWIAGRYHSEVYVINTTDGSLIARIPTDLGPHGLSYFPSSASPHSVGHNGVYVMDD